MSPLAPIAAAILLGWMSCEGLVLGWLAEQETRQTLASRLMQTSR